MTHSHYYAITEKKVVDNVVLGKYRGRRAINEEERGELRKNLSNGEDKGEEFEPIKSKQIMKR